MVTLPCGHGYVPDFDRGGRLVNCHCGESAVVAAVPTQQVRYDVRAAGPGDAPEGPGQPTG